MDCREAKRRLKQLDALPETDSDLGRHAATCTSCARLLESAAILNEAFDQARSEHSNETSPSFMETRRAVERKLQSRTWVGWQWVADFWNFGTAGARWGLSAGVATAVLAFLTLVPFHYQKTVGYEVAFAGVDPELARHEDRLQALLTALGAQNASVSWLGCDSVCSLRVSDLPELKQCRLLAGALEELCNVRVLESGARICEIESGPLLEVALNRVRGADPGRVSQTEARELLQACLAGGAQVCTVADCDSALAAACSELCPGTPIACCLVGDSVEICCLAQGVSCGEHATGTGSCRAGSCVGPEETGSSPTERAASVLPSQFGLTQNHPNPFNPVTEIAFTLPAPMEVRLEVYNALGRKVRTLVSGVRSAGSHAVVWDARSDEGRSVPSGTYLYRLSAGELVQSKTMTLLK